jgi:Domain of Unknown Function (DUF1206)
LKLALGAGGKTTNQKGALETVAHQPFGKFLLILVAVGLAGYSVWRLIRAAFGHGPEGSDNTIDTGSHPPLPRGCGPLLLAAYASYRFQTVLRIEQKPEQTIL